MSFRKKLLFSHLILSLLVIIAFYGYIRHLIDNKMTSESVDNLIKQAKIAKIHVEALNSKEPQKVAKEISSKINARFTLITADGVVTADSGVSDAYISSLENHAQRPEFIDAIQKGEGWSLRYSKTLNADMLYAAILCNVDQNRAVLRLALPLEYLQKEKEKLHTVMGITIFVLILLSGLLSAILANIYSKPLYLIADAASKIGAGEKGVKIAAEGGEEFSYLATVLNEMSGRLEMQMQSISAEQQKLEAVFKGMGEGVVVIDDNGRVVLYNPSFKEQFRVKDEIRDKMVSEVVRNPLFLEAFNDSQTSVEHFVKEIELSQFGLTLLSHWVPLKGENGSKNGVVAVFLDISELKRLEAVRKDFVANASHELRTPLAVIKGYSDTLLDGALDDSPIQARKFVEKIASNADRLSALVNDILLLSKLESADNSLNLKPLKLSEVIDKSCRLITEYADKKRIKLKVDIEGSLGEINGDAVGLEQLFSNLLENAVKYTPEGREVSVSSEEKNGRAIIYIKDTGIGIQEKYLPRIFERFYRVDEARSREAGGTGLGLAIVKHIVQLHGGEISVDSVYGKGTTFKVSFQLL